MAEKAKKKNNQNLITGICVAVVVIVVIIIAVILATRGGTLNDSYFVSDGTKYVLTIETADIEDGETDSHAPLKVHSVYTYSGDQITGLKIYYEYADATAAKAAFDSLTDEEKSGYKEIALDGKYLVLVTNESDYEGLTASEVKQQIEFIDSLKNMNAEDAALEETETVEVTESDAE